MRIEQILISALIGYVFGCFQTAYLVGKYAKKIDIRKHGSNNAGASNVTQVLGWKFGVITAVSDILKAALAVFLVSYIYPGSETLLFIAGSAAILGHNYPINLGLKGGKGTASFIGMMMGIDFKIALASAVAIVLVTIITDYIAIGTFAMYGTALILIIFTGYNPISIAIILILFILCIYKHMPNIKRILNGTEKGLRETAKKKQASI